MITDIFLKRYCAPLVEYEVVPNRINLLFEQVAQIVFDQLAPLLSDPEDFFKRVHIMVARELGSRIYLHDGAEPYDRACTNFLKEEFDDSRARHGTPDFFVKCRMSHIELFFREYQSLVKADQSAIERRYLLLPGTKERVEAFKTAVTELNHRLCEAQLPLHYHNGMIQQVDDRFTNEQIEEPFWEILRDAKWANVEIDMKEAIDRRDTGGRDAAWYAVKALESTLKIISDEKNWKRGNEKGAANYVDNLMSSANGRFIDVWEGDTLKLLFSHVRNPLGHGPGNQPQASFSKEQNTWVIDSAMSWIKSLVRRM